MTTKIPVTETMKQEGGKHVLYSKDGKKVLGRFDSEDEAKKHEQKVQAMKKLGMAQEAEGLALQAGVWVLAEGGRCALTEADTSVMGDESLQALRRLMVDKYAACDAAFRKLGDQRYSSTQGCILLRDMGYYSSVLSRLESELAYRLIPLDGGAGDE